MKRFSFSFYYFLFFIIIVTMLVYIFTQIARISHKENNEADEQATSQTFFSSTEQTTTPQDNNLAVDPDTLPNEMQAWWFMKNKEHKRPSAQEDIDLSKYNAYYLGKEKDEKKKKTVYLTFDCGYENGFTPKMLDILKKHKASAAFFLCKYFIKDQPELVKRMKKEGHIVGNHTANHICMPQTDSRKIREEITANADYMKEATGYEMDSYFRPPKGEYSERTLQIIKDLGYTTVFWSLAYMDYDVDNQPGSEYVIDQFDAYIHPGAIPLIHNVSQSNAEALDTVLTNLEKQGYSFQSLNNLTKTKLLTSNKYQNQKSKHSN